MKRKLIIGISFGFLAGIIDIIPMIIQHLTWDANISALCMWIIVGLFISALEFNINSIVKGVLIAFLVLLPSAILIGWKEPFALIPIAVMTTILGGLLGFTIQKLTNKQ